MPGRAAVLLVDDDARLAAMVAEYLGRHDVEVTVAPDGERGLAALARGRFEAVILDVMLPDIDGLEVCRRLRAQDATAVLPVLMLTARGDDVDKIVGLELGADDYLAKPFNPRELLARLRALLRRAAGSGSGRGGMRRLRAGALEIDLDAREVTVDGRRVSLTSHEFELLAVLARAAGRVLSRDQIMDAIEGRARDVFDRSIDVHVARLRAKLERDPRAPRLIKTVRGVGYMLARDADGAR